MPTKAQLQNEQWVAAAHARERKHNEMRASAAATKAAKRVLARPQIPGLPLHKALDHAVRKVGRSAKAAARLAVELDAALDELRAAQAEAKARR